MHDRDSDFKINCESITPQHHVYNAGILFYNTSDLSAGHIGYLARSTAEEFISSEILINSGLQDEEVK